MLDQSFSADNFRKILDYENRKGVYLEDRFFPSDVVRLAHEIKGCNDEYKKLRHERDVLDLEEFSTRRKAINEQKATLKKNKDALIYAELQKFSEDASKKNFTFNLAKKIGPNFRKPTYAIEDKPESFFAMKQIQNNFRYLYKVKQSNRFAVISQIKNLLSDGFPKIVVRTDIKDFYESIPHTDLLKQISDDSILSFQTRQLVYKLLKGYGTLSGSLNKGLPRGIGVSAYLSELYLRSVDARIREMEDVFYYARYVDDIIVMFTPSIDGSFPDYSGKIRDVIEGAHKLKQNLSKTKVFDLRDHRVRQPKQPENLVFLGYELQFIGDKISIEIGMPRNKIIKYCHRINAAFFYYHKDRKVHEKKARKFLIKRLRFLTSNCRLKSRKQHVITGIYYSNSLMDNMNSIMILDKFLKSKIIRNKLAPSFTARLLKFSFSKGFENRAFSPFSTADLSKLVKIWK